MKGALKKTIAEFLATLMFFSLAYIVAAMIGVPGATGLVWGGSLAFSVLVFGRYGVAHCNPAVSLGAMTAGRLPWWNGFLFWIAQFAASVVSVLLASLFVLRWFDRGFAEQQIVRPVQDLDLFTPFFWSITFREGVAAFFLTLAVLVATDKKAKDWADWLIIGAVLGLFVWIIGPDTGGSVNPFRNLGPWVLASPESCFIVTLAAYVVSHMTGGVLAGAVARSFKDTGP